MPRTRSRSKQVDLKKKSIGIKKREIIEKKGSKTLEDSNVLDATERKRLISFKIGDKVYKEVIDENIELSELSSERIQDALNRAVGKFAYYGSIRADAKRLQAKIKTEYEAWRSVIMKAIWNRPENRRDSGKKVEILFMTENTEEFLLWQRKQRDLDMITDKLYVLVQSFELMTKTLQSILAMRRVELDTAGRGGPADDF